MLVGVMFALTSCAKETLEGPTQIDATSKEFVSNNNKDGGGDDDEWIIIYGLTEDDNNDPIADVMVIVFDSEFSNPLDTVYSDSYGDFSFSLNAGSYYFKASVVGYQNLETSAISYTTTDSIKLELSEI